MKVNQYSESNFGQDVKCNDSGKVIIGDNNDNYLEGGDGDDIIYGGGGQDTLKGGRGHDTFLYLSRSESTFKSPDIILDFETGIDKINLAALKIKSADEIYLSYEKESNTTQLVLDPDLNCFPGFNIIIVGQVDLATDIVI